MVLRYSTDATVIGIYDALATLLAANGGSGTGITLDATSTLGGISGSQISADHSSLATQVTNTTALGTIYSATGTGWTASTSFSDVTSAVLSLPAGKYEINAKGNFDFSTATVQSYDVELRDATNNVQLDLTQVYATTSGRLGWSLHSTLNVGGTTTVKVRALTSGLSGGQLCNNVKVWARPVLTLA